MQQLQQKDWCEQQIREKNMRKEHEKNVNNLFDSQALQFHDTLKETQTEHNKNRFNNEKECERINQVLADQKRQKEDQMHETWKDLEKKEIEYTTNHDFMTENPQTEVSMLAPHRVKPYHFKGFNQQQKDTVFSIRDQQIADFKKR